MRQIPDNTAAEAVREVPPAPVGFWVKARELADWMEEQDSRTN